MAKLRKMLGKADDVELVTLMRQIETQSKTTLARWAADCAKNWYLPIAQAAARAIVTACGVLQTPTNALGFCFYGAAAAAYHELGLKRSAADYGRCARVELQRLSQALEQVMVPDEADPVQVDWNC